MPVFIATNQLRRRPGKSTPVSHAPATFHQVSQPRAIFGTSGYLLAGSRLVQPYAASGACHIHGIIKSPRRMVASHAATRVSCHEIQPTQVYCPSSSTSYQVHRSNQPPACPSKSHFSSVDCITHNSALWCRQSALM